MGCDIHLFVETCKDGVWRSADEWIEEVDDDFDDEGNKVERKIKRVPYEARFYSGRNYDLFAILADVRNGYGFAGCDTGDGFVPIDSPRGLPADVTDEVSAESDRWGVDGHSHSYFTVAELEAYDWDQRTRHRGWVTASEYADWINGGRGCPRSCAGDVFGRGVKKISNEEMDALLKSGAATDEVYTQVEWGESYRECCANFLDTVLPNLKALGNPEDVRIVFFFDN